MPRPRDNRPGQPAHELNIRPFWGTAGHSREMPMDLVCTRCGEPWDLDHVLHEDPDGFHRKGGLIEHCPSCPREKPALSVNERLRLTTIAAVAQLLGDDVDGLAAALEDSGLL